eukprot:gene6975-9535_t
MILKDIVLIGGGHTHLHVIKMFGMYPMQNVRVTLITNEIFTPYSGMIPGYIAGYYSFEECHIDLLKLCSFSNVQFINAKVNGLDTMTKLIYCDDGRPPISYDVLSINIGITPKALSNAFHDQDNGEHITPVKPISGFSFRWKVMLNRVIEEISSIEHNTYSAMQSVKPFIIAIVGGGGGGVELSFSMTARLRKELQKANLNENMVKIIVVGKSSTVMPTHSSIVQELVAKVLLSFKIDIHLNSNVIGVDYDTLSNQHYFITSNDDVNDSNKRIPFDYAIWCTQAIGQEWLSSSGLSCTDDHFVSILPTLQSVSHPNVFACGDICNNIKYPRPKAGVFAVRAGPILYNNIKKYLINQELEEWIPQEEFLGLIGTGNGYAIATKGGIGIMSKELWKLKDKIDRDFMRKYQEFPEMSMNSSHMMVSNSLSDVAKAMGNNDIIAMLSENKMRCGGCGSKVGSQILTRVLNRIKSLQNQKNEYIITQSGDDAALVKAPSHPFQLVHTIDYFRSSCSDLFLLGQISANHALSDIFAMNATPVSALSLCVLPYGLEEKTEESLVQILAGTLRVLNDVNCSLIGGHTSEGAEIAIGLSVNGIVHPDKVLHKGKKNESSLFRSCSASTVYSKLQVAHP